MTHVLTGRVRLTGKMPCRHRHKGKMSGKVRGRNDSAVASHRSPEVIRSYEVRILPWSLHREHGPAHPLISDFEPPELWDKKLLPLQAT